MEQATVTEPTVVEEGAASLLAEIASILREETGLRDPLATMVAEAVLRGLRKRRGGTEVYVPQTVRRTEIAQAVRQMFDGRNRDEVCRRFGISTSTLYRIVRS